MARPNCYACRFSEARVRGLCWKCHAIYRDAGVSLAELRRREGETAGAVAAMAKQILKGIKRDPDHVIAQRRQELLLATDAKYQRSAA